MNKLFFVFAAMVLATGCASIHDTGFLDNYDELKTDGLYGRAYVNEDYRFDSAKTFFIKEPEWSRQIRLDGYESKMYSGELRQAFMDELEKRTDFVLDKDGYGDLELESYIGVMDPGNGFLRWFLGMGFGSSDLQVESRLKDTVTGETIMTYAYRRRDAGNPAFGLNLSEMDEEKQMRNAMNHVAKQQMKFLAQTFAK